MALTCGSSVGLESGALPRIEETDSDIFVTYQEFASHRNVEERWGLLTQ